ncbi:MAG TPA: alkaline phosphatase family protein [Minicystis sp.]|nr:alkaline phosphatase family protein [Minicystis sp.]
MYVSSHDGVVHALSFDTATGALALDDAAAAVPLPMGTNGPVYASGLAVSPDGTKLVVTTSDTPSLHVYSIVDGAGYGAELGAVDLGAAETFQAAFDPNDPTGDTVYVTMWSASKVVAVDLTKPASPKIAATYATRKAPEAMAFLDARFLAVADAFGDAISLVDRVTKEVTTVPVDVGDGALHGGEPTVLAFDAAASRIYVADAGDDAVVAFDVDLAKTPPKLPRAGRFGSAWWPSGIAVRPGGDLVVTNLRGHGGGPIPMPWSFDDDIGDRMKGSVELVPRPAPADLAAGDAQVAADDDPAEQDGVSRVSCPDGAADFPIPATNAGGSPVIDHVFFILRENKDYDSLFGDFASGDGDAAYTMKASSKDMDAIWHNLRAAARAFAMSDDYYTDAVFSTQGHVLATYGRTSDFDERTWIVSGDRDGSPRKAPGGGVVEAGRPVEGSAFQWLFDHHVPFDILGEIVGQPDLPPGAKPVLDIHYPGVAQDITLVDLPKACYAAGRLRVGCDLGRFVYQTLPNDHTIGVSASNPTPETMCAVNDEATGMMLDAISHSPYWKSSLVVITEDDPSQGGEHVDGHRTPLVLVSPWVKRGYVSHAHVDTASIHKIVAHVFGLPYPNRQVERAAIPFDAFTSTPDYGPFEYAPRTWPLACGATIDEKGNGGPPAPAEEELTRLWDFSREDRQPGLGAQVSREMRGQRLEEVTPAMRAAARRFAPSDDDD